MAADAAIYDNESLALKHTGSIDKEIITIEESRCLHAEHVYLRLCYNGIRRYVIGWC